MIELLPLIEIAISFAVVALGTVGSFVLTKVASRFNVEIDDNMNKRINEAIEFGLKNALEKVGKERFTVSHKNEIVTAAANYAIQGVPKALNHFGIDEARVRELVEARLSGQLPADPVVSEGSTEGVVVE